jgi:hypothetical protein
LVLSENKDNKQLEKLQTLYKHARTRPCGHTVEYRGYTLEKVDWNHPDHDEYNIRNQTDIIVESYTIKAFDSAKELKQRLDQLINQKPATLKEAIQGRQ